MTAPALEPLRPYQLQAAAAIIDSVARRRGLSFSVEMARQAGKNELSARIELFLLATHLNRDVTCIKAAPTLRPQARISLDRLWDRIADCNLQAWARREQGYCIRLGRARQVFLSAARTSNVVGHTADLLLEVDEAQDVDAAKFDKELRPMAAARAATTVLYGTAWDETNLLERSRQAHLELERRDGVRRHFEYDWRAVAACNPDYERFVREEERRLGADHPLFLTQFCLRPLPGAGRLFGPTQLSLLRGSHSRLDSPRRGETYVAGLDLAGEAVEPAGEAGHDATVLTLARLLDAPPGPGPVRSASVEVVRHYAWTGAPHTALYGALVSLLRETWRVRRVAVDATGLGEPVAAFLAQALGSSRVEAVKLSAARKSSLGFQLLEAVNAGRLRLYDAPACAEAQECWRQLELCRAFYRANRTLGFHVEAADGHDDYVVSLALAVAAAAEGAPRRARGRAQGQE
jgi:hypothetical protein